MISDEQRFRLMTALADLDEFGDDPEVVAARAYADAVIEYAEYADQVDAGRLLDEADPELREFVVRTLRFLQQTTEVARLASP